MTDVAAPTGPHAVSARTATGLADSYIWCERCGKGVYMNDEGIWLHARYDLNL